MAYRMVYLRIQCRKYDPAGSDDTDLTAFKAESRRLFRELGWTVHEGRSGVCDTVTKDRQALYLHPTSFSGVLDEANIPSLQEQLSSTQSFRCYAVDCYEEYLDMSDTEYRNILESKRGEIAAFILEQYRTKRTNLYITDSVAEYAAECFEIRRLCDKDGQNGTGKRFMFELVTQLLQEGRLVAAETDNGLGIRAATVKERRISSQPEEQVNGQITIMEQIEEAAPQVIELANELTQHPKQPDQGMQL